MIGGKVVLTYKRKRLSSRLEFCEENGSLNTSSVKHEKEQTDQDHELENQRRHSVIVVDHELPGVSGDLLPCDNCLCPYQLRCLYTSNKGERLCTGCLVHQDSLMSLQGQTSIETDKEKTILTGEHNTEQIYVGCCSYANSGFTRDEQEGISTAQTTEICKDEKLDLARIRSCKDELSIMSSDKARESRASLLITFSRRSKRKDKADRKETQSQLVVSTTTTACEEAPALMNFIDRTHEKVCFFFQANPLRMRLDFQFWN